MRSKVKIFNGFKQFAAIILFLVAILAISFLIVVPLWTIATHDKALYSQVVLITLLSLFAIYLIYKTVKSIRLNGFKGFFKISFAPAVLKILKIIGTLLLILITVNLYSISLVVGIIATVLSIFLIGFLTIAFKK